MSDSGDKSVKMLERINKQLRGAVLASFPCAFEQYVCISMPGTIIDTRLGGSYLPEGEKATADVRNMIQINESTLVDSMVPLDKVMLGPTGKSVTRSYYTALDMLVPRKTDIGSVDVETDFSSESKSKYSQAMRFLRSKESILTPDSEVKGSRVALVKDKAAQIGIQGTVVDRYVEKQLAWSEARGKWDAVRSEALEAREARPEMQSAAAFSARQKDIKRAQGELHARWMDWVVNGDKFRVDYCFALVDRDSVMARIERAKEATRDAMLTSIDGTEWAQVSLEPKNWAALCREKALAWAERNPVDTEFLEMRAENLRKMLASYNVYKETFLDDKEAGTSGTANVPPATSGTAPSGESQPPATSGSQAPAASSHQEATIQSTEAELQQALRDIYTAEVAINDAKKKDGVVKDPELNTKLEVATKKWLNASKTLAGLRSQFDVNQLTAAGRHNLSRSISSHIEGLKAQLDALDSKIAKAAGGLNNIILGVRKDETIIRSGDADAEHPSSAVPKGDGKSADVWTKIKFDVSTKEDEMKSKENNLSGSFNVDVGSWWASVKAQTTVSSSSKTFETKMSQCSVSGSFSAMVVTIRRPWLHADLFQDFDIDIPEGTKLSPGARTMRDWIENGDETTNDKRTNYGKFPAYPTSFIVAADTVLEFKSNEAASKEMASSLSTDSSIQASYGPWGLKTGASVKTDNKESSQKMTVNGGTLRIEFQAPQIIGWVSEILPQLPRGADAYRMGGLNAPPNMAFRANL
ncbi:hypothetical protein Asppvi_001874 [Aspergillus pseudoviridinutans]|uniref:Uncharacterized protein n=1 Tax=Aspergillus pseudoviridinutans TaxID=1517512 RepID=A0A9P3BJZ7_9EURO|nr:uncharacterized protein Asppvi_001874 [Aspergillus pseudoviridinutans]GIJ92596.1 hypothetical protein Asppvi_001874 [Aspergillus pseudoviridinutans]